MALHHNRDEGDMAAYKPILVVEDSGEDERMTLFALKRYNVMNEIVVARDGEEALDYLFAKGRYSNRDPKVTPQLVLLDLRLPGLDGLQVLKALRADPLTKLTPVVIFTSSDEETDQLKSYNLGINGYVRKSLELGDFLGAVRQIGLFWLELNVTPGDEITESKPEFVRPMRVLVGALH